METSEEIQDSIKRNKYMSVYDIKEKQEIQECKLTPTGVHQEEQRWLWAMNNKYDLNDLDYDKIGKWMIFVSPTKVNSIWSQIKEAIKEGNLWQSKVSTSHPQQRTHAIMIYTTDYTDLSDVINVLDFLEQSRIKHPKTVIKYKTDNQTRAGIYRGGVQTPWIYSSNTVREQKK